MSYTPRHAGGGWVEESSNPNSDLRESAWPPPLRIEGGSLVGARRFRGVRLASLVVVAALAFASARATQKTAIVINPGPAAISAEEAAIQADPGAGVQHGVILLEETSRNEDHGTGYVLSYHMRAKILSPEGRGLADIEIPIERSISDLKTWWGRTILPDGKVLELPERALNQQTVASTSTFREVTLKAALPGVVPGAVIDYGYVVRGDGVFPITTVELEREWPVRLMRYRWVPSTYLPGAYTSTRVEGRDVKFNVDRDSILITAQNLSPVKEEPYMPPEGEVRASVTLYYGSSEKVESFWDLEAKRVEMRVKSFSNASAFREVIAGLDVRSDATLATRLTAAYDWIGKNLTNTYFKTAEEQEADEETEDEAFNARSVLKAREGTGRQIDLLFAGMARALGAESVLIYAVDRRVRYWNLGLKSKEQFLFTFVGVREPGAGDEAWTVVDPGSGLPYGELPWAATGTTAFVCTPKGMGSLVIQPSTSARNRSITQVAITFTEENESIAAKWSRTGLGASGMDPRRWLRDLGPSERKVELDRLCGGVGSGEVLAAELPGLENPQAPFKVACDITTGETSLTEEIGHYAMSVIGPWWPPTPELTDAARVHPVVFDYPKLDIVSLDLMAPEGFTAQDAPAPVKLETPFGKYQFVAVKNEKGFHVDRAFALMPLLVKPADYEGLRSFLKQVQTADRTSLSFRRTGKAR